MADMTYVLDLILVAFGVYLTYGAVMLGKKGIITPNIMLPKNGKPEDVKDKEGFANMLYGKLLVLGIVTTVISLVIFVNDILKGSQVINYVSYLLFAVALVVYSVALKKAHKRYL